MNSICTRLEVANDVISDEDVKTYQDYICWLLASAVSARSKSDMGINGYFRVHFWSCWGRDFSLTVQSISLRITVLGSVIQSASFFCLVTH